MTIYGHHSVVGYLRWRNALPDLSKMPPEDARDAFYDAHQNRCAVCRNEAARLLVDHDHATGLIRGLLCRSCNRLAPSVPVHISRVKMADLSRVLVLYTQWPPAAVAGLCQRYVPTVAGRDPAPRVHEILWHAGPDGVEHDRIRRSEAMASAIEGLPTLADLLGHSIETARRYTLPTEDERRAAIESLPTDE